jgi:hypothetical protein
LDGNVEYCQREGVEIETGGPWIGTNGDRGGRTDRDKICQRLVPQHGRGVHDHELKGGKLLPGSQGGVALAWRENDLKFKVKLVLFHGPNMLTFQLMMRDEQIYVVETYIPPKLHEGGGGYSQRSGGVPGRVQTACHGGPEHQP